MASADRDITAQARSARLTYHLLLRATFHLPGYTMGQIATFLRTTRDIAEGLWHNLAEYPELPCYHDDRLLCVTTAPILHVPPRNYSDRQTASLAAHYLCTQILSGREAISHIEIAGVCGIKKQSASRLLMGLGGRGGIPIYCQRGIGWQLLTKHLQIAKINSSH